MHGGHAACMYAQKHAISNDAIASQDVLNVERVIAHTMPQF